MLLHLLGAGILQLAHFWHAWYFFAQGSGAWFDKAFAKSTAASEGWPGGEEDLKGPAGEDAAPRASNRGGKKVCMSDGRSPTA